MNPLLLLGYIGLPAYITGSVLNTATLKDPNLKPKIWGIDARTLIGGLGVLGTALFTGPLGLLGAGAAIGSLISWDGTRKVQIGLNQQSVHQAQAQAQIPMQMQPALPGPVPPVGMPVSQVPAQEQGWIDQFLTRFGA